MDTIDVDFNEIILKKHLLNANIEKILLILESKIFHGEYLVGLCRYKESVSSSSVALDWPRKA